MSVRLRLTRVGNRKNPIWRVVVADQRAPRDGRFIEVIGQYNPQTQPSTVNINKERAEYWIARGAQPSNTVSKLLKVAGRQTQATEAVAAQPAEAEPATQS